MSTSCVEIPVEASGSTHPEKGLNPRGTSPPRHPAVDGQKGLLGDSLKVKTQQSTSAFRVRQRRRKNQ